MTKYTPGFVFDSVASLVARRFLTSSITLAQMSAFYTTKLENYYDVGELSGDLENCAENFLRSLSEINIDNSDQILRSFEHLRLTTTDNHSPRKIKSMFSSSLDGTSSKEYIVDSTIKRFRAFIFLTRSKPEYIVKDGWTWKNVEGGEWLSSLDTENIDPFDFL